MNIRDSTVWMPVSCLFALAAVSGGPIMGQASRGTFSSTFSGACIGDIKRDQIDLLASEDAIKTVVPGLPVSLNSARFAASSPYLAGPTNTGMCVVNYGTRDFKCFKGVAAEDYAISRDGHWLAYSGIDRVAGGKGLFVLEVTTGRRIRVSASGRQPAWSSDARELVYEDESSVRVIPRSGGTARLLAAGADPSWSPTDGVIVYRSRDETFERVSPEGRTKGTLAGAHGFLGALQWSPDGGYLLGTKLGWDQPRSRPCLHDHITIVVISAKDGETRAAYPYCGPGAWRYTWIPAPDICSSRAVR